jgi:lauroyl/myristoyl acyltransferase
MVRLQDDTFAYIVEEPIWADKSRHTVDDVMRQIALALERVIRQYSEQWFLFHDLWDVESDRALAAATAFGTPAKDTAVAPVRQAAGHD